MKVLVTGGTPKTCIMCGQLFQPYRGYQRYCSPRWRWEFSRRKRDPSKVRLWHRRSNHELQSEWGKAKYQRNLDLDPKVIQSELYAAQEILPGLGFDQIVVTRQFSRYFPFDILARKEGRICLVDVTLGPGKYYEKKRLTLARFLDARVFTCHIRPDFSEYYLIGLQPKRISTCAGGLFLRGRER